MMDIERKIVELVAADRIDVPISSMSGKLKRRKPKMAQAIDLEGKRYFGDRAFAYERERNYMKARGVKEGIEKFAEKYPKHAKVLQKYIDEEREVRERHLVFGMKKDCIVNTNDYMGIMTNLGFTEPTAERLYPELMNISRKLKRKRDESERKILIEQDF